MFLRKTALTFFFALGLRGAATAASPTDVTFRAGEMILTLEASGISSLVFPSQADRPSPLFQLFRKKQAKNKKLTAALLAFPFPLGIVGMHRIYLGTAPYVPVVYIASVGGVFGILPFIDFCMILLEKDVERYSNNTKVFMWVE
jgi:TM2 domain-containing membrane protein YozV